MHSTADDFLSIVVKSFAQHDRDGVESSISAPKPTTSIPPQSVNPTGRWTQSHANWQNAKSIFGGDYSFWLLSLMNGNMSITVRTKVQDSTIVSRSGTSQGVALWNESKADVGKHERDLVFTMDTFYAYCRSILTAITDRLPFLSTYATSSSSTTGIIFCCGRIALDTPIVATFDGLCVVNIHFYLNGNIKPTMAAKSSPITARYTTINTAYATTTAGFSNRAPMLSPASTRPATKTMRLIITSSPTPNDGSDQQAADAQLAVDRGSPLPAFAAVSSGCRLSRAPGFVLRFTMMYVALVAIDYLYRF